MRPVSFIRSRVSPRLGGGRTWLLWVYVVVFSLISTVFLSLDTTAVLLTPVVIVLARRTGVDPMPFAVTALLLANTGSLLLPVSNLTNLLAVGTGANAGAFAARMALPALVGVVVPAVCVLVVYRRTVFSRYSALPRHSHFLRYTLFPRHSLASPSSGFATDEPADDQAKWQGGITSAARSTDSSDSTDSALLRWSGTVVALLLPALVIGVPVWIPALVAAIALVVVFAKHRPRALSVHLVPWQLVVLLFGLFLAVPAALALGVEAALAAASGSGDSPASLVRLALAGAAGSNLVNNLPAFLALEPLAGSQERLMALLIGVNAGPLVTPWASLATLLWMQRTRSLGVDVQWWRVGLLGLVVAVLTVTLATLVLSII